MNLLKIFVASSSEGEVIAGKIQKSLQGALGAAGVVEMWRSKFEFSDVAIESLEKVADEADFAVVLMSGDDTTISRERESVSPRDNLVFELGLFIGGLGRSRTVLARDEGVALKLPSDVLSLTALLYRSTSPEELAATIEVQCGRLATLMSERGIRPKWLTLGRSALASNGDFCKAIEGSWWERVNYGDGTALSYFTIAPDPMAGSMALEGVGYGRDLERCALWRTEMVRLDPTDRRVSYLWRGTHPLPDHAHLRFHGYGSIDFDQPNVESATCTRGTGVFWDVDEARPESTISKASEVRRVQEEAVIRVMSSSNDAARREVIGRALKAW